MGIFNDLKTKTNKLPIIKIPLKANQNEVNNGGDDKYMTGNTFLHSDTINKLINPNTPIYYAKCAHNKNDNVKFYPGDNINVKATTGFTRKIEGRNQFIPFEEAGMYHITYIDGFQNIKEDTLYFDLTQVDLINSIKKYIPHNINFRLHSYDIIVLVRKKCKLSITCGGYTIMEGINESRLIIYRISAFPDNITPII